MKKLTVLLLLLCFILNIHAISDSDLHTNPNNKNKINYTIKSPINILNKNPIKFTLGYTGYFAANITPLILLLPVNFYAAIGSTILLAPITGPIGSSLGVYLAGAFQGKESSFYQTTTNSYKGSLFSFWTYLIPIPIINPILNPIFPTTESIKGFNSKAISPQLRNAHHTMSIHPISLSRSILRLVNLNELSNSPLKFEYERLMSQKSSIYVEGIFQNHPITEEYQEDAFFSVSNADASKTWRSQYYNMSVGLRRYSSENYGGFYIGSGLSLFYASFLEDGYEVFNQDVFNDIQTWDSWSKETGNGYFVKPFIEMGYKLFLTQNLFIKSHLRSGPVLELNTSNMDSDSFNFYPYLKDGNGSFVNQLSFQTGWSW